ncbi:MAG: outer membrane protein assembly factor BamA [Bacteroidetes bacterium]|jgi:outer membrane protein insertion porin family|nr:outer membrane protein assembly factor BamA [Bacteroidota bacterium]MBT6686324.1 outer membrane protein assembly factor BamA [Bacteroidota bacterium]MBT7142157.1 outer membrane protein assembly factor BamA [Bacteroidota bacterium]MBT7490488.1 outer membrane protein assembly factor BamA [Bacteroidota bacterium]
MLKKIFLLTILILIQLLSFSQISLNSGVEGISYASPKEYELGGVTVSGIKYLDGDVLVQISGLAVGQRLKVPGEEISKAIEKLWKQGLFSDVKISAIKIVGDKIFLNIHLQERARLSKWSYEGIKKSQTEDLNEKLNLLKGSQLTANVLNNSINKIKDYFIDKGFLNTEVTITQKNDTNLINHVILKIHIDKKERIKIQNINIEGNTVFSDKKLRKTLKETKQKTWYNIFKSSKYISETYKEDKLKIIDKYNSEGYRDAKIVSDSIYVNDEKTIKINIKIEEGNKFYFRNVSWIGNSKYSNEQLDAILDIKKGDLFDQSVLDEKLYMDERGITSIYMDDGYLFFNANPVEVKVENDSIDIEIRIYEGKQARINKITVTGNTKTNDHVIRREIRTKPGELFSRSDIIRTQRELAQLGYFDPEKLGVNPTPNQVDGTVDIEYVVEEKPSDQIELSGGWGAGMIVGTLGLSFNNFSAKNVFKKGAWRPLPAGDGQRLSVRAQSNGIYYQAYNLSFVEPWLGGKKPNSFTVSSYYTIQSNGRDKDDPDRTSMTITGLALGLGKRLKAPDDFFTLYNELSFQHYDLNKWSYFIFQTGTSKNLSISSTFARNSIDQPIYPRRGSLFSLKLQVTPPYSLLNNKDYSQMTDLDKYEWIEYHKWNFKASWFSRIAGDLVLNTKAEFGFLGYFNSDIGPSPFEGFNVGGDGLSGYNLYGRETIALRGYDNGALTPSSGGNIYNKLTMELRYPLSLNPQATLYGLAFLEAGNCWYESRNFNPFDVKRAAGIGVRIFLPMFGMLGVDFGYGFDEIEGKSGVNKWQPHFIIGQRF